MTELPATPQYLSHASCMPAPSDTARHFSLCLSPDEDGASWGFALTEAFGSSAEFVAQASSSQAALFRRAVLSAVCESGYHHAHVSPRRRAPFALTQAAGVKLALTVRAAMPIKKPLRRHDIIYGIEGMSSEEALYWYARVSGSEGERALRALRLLLAEQ